MKTIKTFVSDLLKEFKIQKRNKPESNQPDFVKQSTLLTQKNERNETETDEGAGNPGMDHTIAGQTAGNAEKRREPHGGKGVDIEKGGELSGVSVESPKEIPERKRNRDHEIEKALKEAYEQGFIEGKNAQIEEKYFPMKEDGIPAFRGCPSPASPANSIFSMAREA